jgi:hypothetical protein
MVEREKDYERFLFARSSSRHSTITEDRFTVNARKDFDDQFLMSHQAENETSIKT